MAHLAYVVCLHFDGNVSTPEDELDVVQIVDNVGSAQNERLTHLKICAWLLVEDLGSRF